MKTLFSKKRDYREWARKRQPVVRELVLLGFLREEIADLIHASVSTIQRDLRELKQRRLIEEEAPKLTFIERRYRVLKRLQVLERLIHEERASEVQNRLYYALKRWAKEHHANEAAVRQSSLPF